jgi:hypothetical protein
MKKHQVNKNIENKQCLLAWFSVFVSIFKQKRSQWKKKRMYGKRWMAKETVFSSIKRMFGEYVSATRFQNTVKEIMMKVSLYNLFRRMA